MTWNEAIMKKHPSSIRGLLLTLGAVVLCGAFIGCAECDSNTDCGPGEICSSGKCRTPGVKDTDETTDTDTFPFDTGSTDTGTETETTDTGSTDTGTETETIDTDTGAVDTSTIVCTNAKEDCPAHETICGHWECSADRECVLVSDKEFNEPCEDDGNECTQNVCRNGYCEAVAVNSGQPCADDGNPCTVNICDAGKCGQAAPGLQCTDDGDPCTNNICDADGVCTAYPAVNGASCEDGLWCTGSNVCVGGVCTSRDAPCATADPCTTKRCIEPLPGQLAGTCGPTETLTNGASCDNGFFCDGAADTCMVGMCIPSGNPCPGSSICNDVRCDETSDACQDDPAPDHSPCPDADLCDGPEACLAGVCEGGAGPCDEQSNCATRSCDDSGGVVVCGDPLAEPDGTVCSSEDVCAGTGTRQCVDGECAYAEAPACGADDADSNFCTRMWPCSPSAVSGEPECKELPLDPTGFQADLALGCAPGTSDTDTDYGWEPVVSFSTVSSNNEVSGYSGCDGAFTGGEAVIEIEVPSGTSYTVTATYVSATSKGELRMLLITDPCDPDGTCSQVQEKTLTATKGAGRQLIVVDGLNGSRGHGQLSVTCN